MDSTQKMPYALFPHFAEFGYVRVAAAMPEVHIADAFKNCDELTDMARTAAESGVNLLTFPELSLTGYSCKDLFLQPQLIDDAYAALRIYADQTRQLPLVSIVGLPIKGGQSLYNAAAIVAQGRILGLVPKTYLPNYGEFEEKRWFTEAEESDRWVYLWDSEPSVLLSPRQIFSVSIGRTFSFGVTICEDDWRAAPPANYLAMAGAHIICNLSASNELVTKAEYRRERLAGPRSSDGICGYVYCSAGPTESTADLVFGGHRLIYENGSRLAEAKPLEGDELLIADIDVMLLARERSRENSWSDCIKRHAGLLKTYIEGGSVDLGMMVSGNFPLLRHVDPRPFVPHDSSLRDERCREIIALQIEGLYQRLRKLEAVTNRQVAIGVSGGLDSTLALLVTVKTFEKLGWDKSGIIAVTMPGPGTSGRTYKNAVALIKALGVTYREISITEAVDSHLRQLGHEPCWKCLKCQNAQARERTQILFDLGFVIGTGDLSEAALGWCTYNGDHMSMYNVNCDIPKTLVQFLVGWFADEGIFGWEVSDLLAGILETPISPELVKIEQAEVVVQDTEAEVGPYLLNDFNFYHIVRRAEAPDKIFYLACIALGSEFKPSEIIHWLERFYLRFFANQFKRDCAPNGPMVGTISASPRGYLRLPSDAAVPSRWLQIIRDIAAAVAEYERNAAGDAEPAKQKSYC